MNVAVLGLWHLGSVTAACLARVGHCVIAWDPEPATIATLQVGKAPIAEPGLDELIQQGITTERLSFTSDVAAAVRSADVVWITFDTPVDDDDHADVEAVLAQVRVALPYVAAGAVVISSSQLPVGTVRRIERDLEDAAPHKSVGVACLPENLRLGKAIERFLAPDRVVAGVRNEQVRGIVASVLAPITDRIVWMSVESAEMTKHAINAFLATSVAFINEIAAIGEAVGADAKEVELGLKSEQRIGPGAYLSPGAAFAGGTLARDLVLLGDTAARNGVPARVVSGVLASNRDHKAWIERALVASLKSLRGKTVAIWGLTYKPGTDTLRRSTSVELARSLAAQGATIRAFDPAVSALPDELAGMIQLTESPTAAASGAAALVIGTEWPEFREVGATQFVDAAPAAIVLDPGRFLVKTLGADERLRYLAVGTPRS